MAILDIQRRLAEIGRIRIGQQVQAANGKTRPAKLGTFRLTSADRLRVEHAARVYGGKPAQWQAPAGKQWEVITGAEAIDVIVPPSDMAFSQHYELWSAGGCQRRCDGRQESISDGPCLCDPESRECDIHTRLSVMLRDLPGLGVWRIDTSGYYAAVELQGAVEVIQIAAGRGQMLPARLRLEQRQVKRPDQPVRRFAVPVLDIEVSPGQLMSGHSPQIGAGAPLAVDGSAPREIDGSAPLTPVPASLPSAPVRSVADQARDLEDPRPKPKRRNAAQPVPATGLEPRTAAQAQSQAGDDGGPRHSTEPGTVTKRQMTRLGALFAGMGYKQADREERLVISSQIIGRDIATAKDLSLAEASALIDTLERCGGQRDKLIALPATPVPGVPPQNPLNAPRPGETPAPGRGARKPEPSSEGKAT